ncbi:hydroxypyruvate isomerase family protein [Chloroflexota bacterium]
MSGHIRQSLCWWCFTRASENKPEDVIREANALGIQGIELAPPDQWEAIKAAGLKIIGIGGHGTFSEGLNRQENHDRIEKELRDNIELAANNDIRNLICFSGNRGGLSDKHGAENTVRGLLRVAKLAEEKGVTLVIELLNSKIDHPDYMADRTRWGVEVCKMVNSPAVKLLYDVYHMQIMEGDLIRTITENIDYIGHFHIAGNPGRSNIDDTQEINYKGVIEAIATTNFEGYVGHEYVPKGDAFEVLRRTYKMCDV